jgi:hypothetical protein
VIAARNKLPKSQVEPGEMAGANKTLAALGDAGGSPNPVVQ